MEKERNGEQRGGKQIILGVCHLHTLEIRDERGGCKLKVKNEMNAFLAPTIVGGQYCVIVLLSEQRATQRKDERQSLKES